MAATLDTPPTIAATIEQLRGVRERIYRTGEVPTATGTPHKVWPIGLTPDRGEALRDLVIREKARAALETGFAFGMSASWILEGLLTNFAARGETPQRPILTSVDPFATRAWRDAGVRHLADAGCSAFHELHRIGSELLLPRLVSEAAAGGEIGAQPSFDFVFIDGDHRFEYVFSDVLHARKLLRPGGLIVVDDAWMPSVRKCIAFFRSARLVTEETARSGSALDKFFLLRVDPAGDERTWDHFELF